MAITPEVNQAIQEIRECYEDSSVTFVEDGDGGAYITVEPIDPGEQYAQRETWIKFHITFQYPVSDVYPHFVRPDLCLANGELIEGLPLGPGSAHGVFSVNGEQQVSAIQISRKSNNLNPGTDTALVKLIKVHDWMRTRGC